MDLKKFFRPHWPILQFIFVEFWVALEIILGGVNHRHWHFIFGIEVQQTDCIFQFNRYFSKKNPVFLEKKSIMQVLHF